jgi:hypothetical protein
MKVLTDTTLASDLDELAALGPTDYPFVSLYLNTQPDQHGHDNFESSLRKEFKARAKAFPPDSPALASFERDAARIRGYLRDELRPSSNGLAVVGSRDTLTALYQGQVDELLLSASTQEIVCEEEVIEETPANIHSKPQASFKSREPHLVAADMLVARARLSGARVTFIEDPELLSGVGGIGALLRYRF